MSAKHLKLIINLVFLSISIFLSTYFMIHLTSNPFIRIGIGVFAVGLEAAMQYILALGRACMKKRLWQKKLNAIILFLCYACYIFIYNIPSAVGFFLAEMDVQDRAFEKVEIAENINKQRLDQINVLINNLNLQLETEAETGYGPRSRAIVLQLEKLSTEQKELQKNFSETSEELLKVSKNPFKSLSEAIELPTNLLAVMMFGVSIAMLCLVLIITSWDIKIEDDESEFEAESETEPEMESNIGEDLKELLTVIGAMYKSNGGNALLGDHAISEKTGIPIQRIAEYKKLLGRVTINGKPLVVRRQGGSEAQFSKEVVEERVKKGV